MALSRVQYEQEVAGNRNFIVTMPYISRDHIKVSVTGSDVPFSWLNSNTVQLATAPNVGDIIDIRRETERQNLLVDFQDASTITEKQLDLATRQGFFLAQEAFDLTNSTMAVAEDGSYSASGRRISLLGEPNSDDDAVTQGWVKGQYNSGYDAHDERVAAEQAASNAGGSEGRAKTSETNAAQSEGKAKTSETNAAQSETKAKTSETNSAQSESNAKTSELEAKQAVAQANTFLPDQGDTKGKVLISDGSVANWNAVTFGGRKNLFDNGDFSVAQEGNWFPDIGEQYTIDCWFHHASGGKANISRNYANGIGHYLQLDPVAPEDNAGLGQRIELPQILSYQRVTLSGWFHSDESTSLLLNVAPRRAATSVLTFQSYNLGTIEVGKWNYFKYSFTLPEILEDDHYLYVLLNRPGLISSKVRFGRLQLELGDTATDFEIVHPATQLARCQRYFQVVSLNGMSTLTPTRTTATHNEYYDAAGLSVTMRKKPEVRHNLNTAGAILHKYQTRFDTVDTVQMHTEPHAVSIKLTPTTDDLNSSVIEFIHPAYIYLDARL